VSEEDFLKSDSLSKQETEKLFQMLEVKLGHERRAWQRAKVQIQIVRALSFVFLFLLVLAAFAAFYIIYYRAQEHRSNKAEPTTLPDR
jgi:hypothetical protein